MGAGFYSGRNWKVTILPRRQLASVLSWEVKAAGPCERLPEMLAGEATVEGTILTPELTGPKDPKGQRLEDAP